MSLLSLSHRKKTYKRNNWRKVQYSHILSCLRGSFKTFPPFPVLSEGKFLQTPSVLFQGKFHKNLPPPCMPSMWHYYRSALGKHKITKRIEEGYGIHTSCTPVTIMTQKSISSVSCPVWGNVFKQFLNFLSWLMESFASLQTFLVLIEENVL